MLSCAHNHLNFKKKNITIQFRYFLIIYIKRDNMKIASLLNKRNTTNANARKLKKAQGELINTCQKEQQEYI